MKIGEIFRDTSLIVEEKERGETYMGKTQGQEMQSDCDDEKYVMKSGKMDAWDNKLSWGKVGLAAKFGAVVLLGVPSTLLIPLPLTQLLTKRFRREEKLKKIHFMVLWARKSLEWVLGAKLMVSGKELIPPNTKGYIFISNHQSYVDILVLMSALDTVAFLSKSMVKRIPVIGRCAYCGGTVFFSRNSPEERTRALEETLKMCAESTAVVVFPEGSRSKDGRIRDKIHPKAILESYRRGLKVIPVGLDGSFEIVPVTMDRVNRGLPVSVHIGEPMDPRNFDGGEEDFVRVVWDKVKKLHCAAAREVELAPN